MSIIDVLFSRTRTVKFEKDPPGEWITLETPDGILVDFGIDEINEAIRVTRENPDYFLMLTLPNAIYGIRYIQACECDGLMDVQLAIEKKKYVMLVEKLCDEPECRDIFAHFFDTGKVDGLRSYRPVRFVKQ